MKNLTTRDYKPRKGNKASKLPSKRELVGYVPMEKRITDLMAAGLRTAMVRDARYYDSIGDELADLPPLPRHIPADLADVSDIARHYQARRAEIEERVRAAKAKAAEKPHQSPSEGSVVTPQADAKG